MGLQNLLGSESSVRQWLRLLQLGGVLGIGVCDFDKPTGTTRHLE